MSNTTEGILRCDLNFAYDRISSNTIRLFRIKRDTNGSIVGELQNFSLDDSPVFRAVSYFCGPKIYDKSITLNGRKLAVLQNAYPLLEMICDHEDFPPGLWWWMDSISINQRDPTELSFQVENMGRIYQGSYKTIIWLGEKSEDSDDAIDFLYLLESKRWKLRKNDKWVRYFRAFELRNRWSALSNLLQRDWWKRVWTLQEFIVSPRSVFYCGKKSIRRYYFNEAIYAMWLCNGYDGIIFSRNAYDSAWNRRRLHQWYGEFDTMPLVAMMAYVGDHEATDPRDRIYSLKALTSDKDREVIGPTDYSKDVKWIYIQFVESFIRVHKSLDIICLAHIFNRKARDLSNIDHNDVLPTWVPDWRAKAGTHTNPLMVSQSAYNHIGNFRPLHTLRWNAAYEASGKSQPKVTISSDSKELTCEGIILDYIDGLGGLKEKDGSCTNDEEHLEYGHCYVPSTSQTNQTTNTKDIAENKISDDELKNTSQLIDVISKCLVLGRKDRYMCNPSPEHFKDDFLYFCLAASNGTKAIDPNFLDWFHLNQNLQIQGQTLQSIIRNLTSESSSTSVLTKIRSYLENNKPSLTDKSDWESFLARFLNTTNKMRRRLIVTSEGYIGMAPCRAAKGDLVTILLGCNVPVVLRPVVPPHADEETIYEFLGECYVQGFMNGEIFRDTAGRKRSNGKFRII